MLELQSQYPLNTETAWVAGLWAADRGSTARGVVSIKNKCPALLDAFEEYSLRNFDITRSKFRLRKTKGYSEATDVYYTRLPVRRFIESLVTNRIRLSGQEGLAFLSGKFDGDGSIDFERSILYYGYSKGNRPEALKDEILIAALGFRTSIGPSGNAVKVRVLEPRKFAVEIIPYVRHPIKLKKLGWLTSKRPWRSLASETLASNC